MRGCKRIRRYVFGQLFAPTALGLLLFTFVLLMNHLFIIAQKAISLGLGWELTLRLLVYELPKLLVMTIPMGTLLGTLIAVGRISADHEWVAMQSAGLGPGDLLRPIASYGLIAALLSFLVYVVVFPRTNFAARELQQEIAKSSKLGTNLRPRVFYTDLPGTVLFVDEIRAGGRGRLDGVLIHRSRASGGFDELILARSGDLYPSLDGSGGLEMDLHQGLLHAYRLDQAEEYRLVPWFESYHDTLDPPAFLQAFQSPRRKTLLDMDLPELIQESRVAREQPEPLMREVRLRSVWRELHARFALPLASLLFAVLSLPLGITRVRSGKGAGFALASMVIVIYWIVFTFARDQGARGRIPVSFGVWAANGVILLWIVFAFWRMRRRPPEDRLLLWRLMDLIRRFFRLVRARFSPRRPGRLSPDGQDLSAPVRAGATNRIVGLLDRYVSLQYLRILGLSIFSIYVVYAIVELKTLLDGALQNDRPLLLVLAYFKYFTPGMLTLVLPISCLVAAVVAFTLMARSGELTAVLSSGVSLIRATMPVLLLTLGFCVLFFFIQDKVAPVTNSKAEEIKDQILGRSPRTYGLSAGGRWTFGSKGRLYHYRLYDPDSQRFQGLSVFTIDRKAPKILNHRYTGTARWDGGAWILGKGWYRTFDDDGQMESYETLDAGLSLSLDPPENFAQREVVLRAGGNLPDQMSLGQIRTQMEALDNSGYDTTRLRVAFYAKFAQPATPLVMVILGLPFAFRIGRRGSLYGIGVALLLVIVYWSTFAVFRALGLETLLPPLLAAWAPNVLYALLGLYLLLHIRT